MEEIKNKIKPIQKYFQDLENGVISMVAQRLGKISEVKATDLSSLLRISFEEVL